MIARVLPRVPSNLTPAPAGYPWIKGMPDLNRQTNQLIGQSGAGWTFSTICRLVHHIGRVGRPQARQAAKERQRLSVGLAAVAAEAGLSEGKVRRDLTKLAGLGLIVTIRPNVSMVRDAEGKLRENRTGRSKATVIVLTICQEHLRQKAAPPLEPASSPARMDAVSPARLEGLPVRHSVHPGGAIQRERNTKRTPVGDAVGIGTPPAEGEAGLPAGQAGGQEAAPEGRLPAAGQEDERHELRIVTVADDEADERAVLPAGRLTPKAAAPRTPQRRPWGHQGHQEPPVVSAWSDADLAALRRQRESLDAQARDADRPRPPRPPALPPPTTRPDDVAHRRRPASTTFDTDRAKADALAALKSLTP